ncbi:uncharacterized protein EHS24_006714 [Apiotrichum porosum]|uniref:Uncharacterized protein n=1 Tax=Apiotrichum porosum TaxID=105984 RepID=A0A427Y216_9TREE|nr:uncharacterized protein EHS24_006714 [Apiotrichum porosum]RSH85121.1 hypothetical protein EHS24_006714 [Apiotrichum porosum]
MSHRKLALEAAGGPLPDLGAYILLPAIPALYKNPANEGAKPSAIGVAMMKSSVGVYLTTTITED